MAPPLVEAAHDSGRAAAVCVEADSVWLYLTRASGDGIDADCWLCNLVPAPLEVSPSYRERGLPPPACSDFVLPGAHCREPCAMAWTLQWRVDGSAVAAFADGACLGIAAAGQPGHARHLARSGPWGEPWSEQRFAALFGDSD